MSRITQKEAYDIYISHKRICSDAIFQIIQNLGVPDDQFETIRWKLRNLQKSLRKAKQRAETVVEQSQQDILHDFLIIN